MDALALLLWGMALGSIALFVLARLGGYARHPTRSRLRAVQYHLAVFLLVLVLSGVLQQLHPLPPAVLHAAQVLAGPLCVGFANHWIHGWLRAAQRDRLMALALRGSALAVPLLGAAALLLPPPQQLPAAAALSLAASVLTLWLTLRGWRMGDAMASAMALGCLLAVAALAGLYGLAMHVLPPRAMPQLAVALCAATSNFLTGLVLLRRDLHVTRARRNGARVSVLDPVTGLPNARSLVHGLVQALRRHQRTGRDGALLAVMVFDVERLAMQTGAAGVNEMWVTLAARIQRQLGVVNPVGRYWDRCFVAVVETIPSLPWLRTVGLRVATSVRHPIEVTGPDGDPVQVWADIGVGVVHLPPGPLHPEDVLHAAQALAMAARGMASRAATFDPISSEIVAVEEAQLARRRGWMRRPAPA